MKIKWKMYVIHIFFFTKNETTNESVLHNPNDSLTELSSIQFFVLHRKS